MTASIPTKEPASFTAGDTLKFKRYFSDYLPADGWVLSYSLVMSGVQITFSSSDNGDGYHLVNVDTTTTAAWGTGYYRWQAVVTKSGERFVVGTGEIEILADFEAATGGLDARSHIKKVLEALEATILGKASSDQLSYTIAGRSLQRMTPDELIKWQNHYQRLYQQEQAKERLNNGQDVQRIIHTRF